MHYFENGSLFWFVLTHDAGGVDRGERDDHRKTDV